MVEEEAKQETSVNQVASGALDWLNGFRRKAANLWLLDMELVVVIDVPISVIN
jgi:hypothetical protein